MHRTPSSMGVSVKLFIHGELNGLRFEMSNSQSSNRARRLSYSPQHNEHSENPVGGIAGVRPLKDIHGHHCSAQGCAEHRVVALLWSGRCRTSRGIIAVVRAVQNIPVVSSQWSGYAEHPLAALQGSDLCRTSKGRIAGVGPLQSIQ